MDADALVGRFAQMFAALAGNIERVVRGKREKVELALICLLSEGHLLVEDVPGVGKTTLARAMSASVEAKWARIQFTPDLLPSDITGVSIFNQGTSAFEFHPGPIFANLVVADEINRGSPKTQSALLEVMEERRVTVEGTPHPVPRPFMVIATQNPVDMDGTYPLPEAQLDRFLMRISMGYPDHQAEVALLAGAPTGAMLDQMPPVMTREDLSRMIDFAQRLRGGAAVRLPGPGRRGHPRAPRPAARREPAGQHRAAARGAGAGGGGRPLLHRPGGREGARGPRHRAPADRHAGGRTARAHRRRRGRRGTAERPDTAGRRGVTC